MNVLQKIIKKRIREIPGPLKLHHIMKIIIISKKEKIMKNVF